MAFMEIRCAIHQPNFFPWLGYFDKIARADIFILLDDAQYQKTGGTWTNRVQIRAGDRALWLTAPVDRSYSGTKAINEIQFSPREAEWREKALKTIQQNYSKTKYYGEIAPELELLLAYETDSLCSYNVNAILGICKLLRLPTSKLRVSSDLNVKETATERLVALSKTVGANTYMCGGGADGYQQDPQFEAAGLRLEYQNFKHPVYAQHRGGVFVPGLSIIDSLMNCGVHGVRNLLDIHDRHFYENK